MLYGRTASRRQKVIKCTCQTNQKRIPHKWTTWASPGSSKQTHLWTWLWNNLRRRPSWRGVQGKLRRRPQPPAWHHIANLLSSAGQIPRRRGGEREIRVTELCREDLEHERVFIPDKSTVSVYATVDELVQKDTFPTREEKKNSLGLPSEITVMWWLSCLYELSDCGLLIFLKVFKVLRISWFRVRYLDLQLYCTTVVMATENRFQMRAGSKCSQAYQVLSSVPGCFSLSGVSCETMMSNSCIYAAGNLQQSGVMAETNKLASFHKDRWQQCWFSSQQNGDFT